MPDKDALRGRFPVGCRVRFAAAARATFALRRDVPATVVGYGRTPGCVRIRREGNRRYSESWSATFLERLEDTDHA